MPRVEGDNNGYSIYSGDTNSEGLREGIGVIRYDNGEIYLGNWIAGRREGRGVYYYADGTVYDGVWDSDKASGLGICYYPSGNIYIGNWEAAQTKGRGMMLYQDDEDDAIDGEWTAGVLNGLGMIYKANKMEPAYWSAGKEQPPPSYTPDVQHPVPPSYLTPVDVVKARDSASRHLDSLRKWDTFISQTGVVSCEDLSLLISDYHSSSTPESLLESTVKSNGVTKKKGLDFVSDFSDEVEEEDDFIKTTPAAQNPLSYPTVTVTSTESIRDREPAFLDVPTIDSSSDGSFSSDEELQTTQRLQLRSIFERIQRNYSTNEGPSKLTRSQLADKVMNDEEVSGMGLIQHQKSWRRILKKDTQNPEEEVSWGVLEKEFEKEVSNIRQSKSTKVFEVEPDKPFVEEEESRTEQTIIIKPRSDFGLKLSGTRIGGFAMTLAHIKEDIMTEQELVLDRQRTEESYRRKSFLPQSSIEFHEAVAPSVLSEMFSGDGQSDSGLDFTLGEPKFDGTKWGQGVKEAPAQSGTHLARLPHGSPDRAKTVEAVLSMCGPAREPFSCSEFTRLFAIMLFPYPFLPKCYWGLSNIRLERTYVVSGALPRWLESPTDHLYSACTIFPLIVLIFVYSFGDINVGRGDHNIISVADVVLPVASFIFLSLTTAVYHAFPRKMAHSLETLPDAHYCLLAEFSYSKLHSLGNELSMWPVTWKDEHANGRYVAHSTYSTRLGLFCGILMGISIPIHRFIKHDSMWGDTGIERVIAVFSAVTIAISASGIFTQMLRINSVQKLLVTQLSLLTSLADVYPDNSIVAAHTSNHFNLSVVGLDSAFNPKNVSELKTLLVCEGHKLKKKKKKK